MIRLHDYQDAAVARLRASIRAGNKSPLLVSPTGSGKTVVFSYLAGKLAEAGKRTVIMDHRDELTDQINRALGQFDITRGIITAGASYYDPRVLTHVGSVFTMARRLEKIAVPDYAIVDEAHHCINGSTWGKVLAHWRERNPRLVVIGVTATPERLSGEGLGQVFDDMVLGPTTAELIDAGYLSPYKLFAPPPREAVDLSGLHTRGGDYVRSEAAGRIDKPTITGSAVAHYRKHCNGAPAVAFCASIEHAEHVAETFRAQGFRAASIDGKMDKGLRRQRVKDFGQGQLNVLTSCDLVSEGFDVPGIVGAILLRPTQSLALFLQQVGRSLRTAPGKSHAVILDHVGNTVTHGLPDDEREWSLDGRERRKKDRDPDDMPVKQCPACYAVNRSIAQKCRECGEAFVVKSRKVTEVEGELAEVDMDEARRQQRVTQAKADSVDKLVAMGYSEGRARHILEARAEKEQLRQDVLNLSHELWRATGESRLSTPVVRALKPKQLRELRDEMQQRVERARRAA